MSEFPVKPLGAKAYGSIGHLPGSRTGPADHMINPGQARMLTEKARDKHDLIIVQEKLDGSCVSVAKIEGEIVPLIRAGYRADSSRFSQHHIFHEWVLQNHSRFDELLADGERVVGEWLALAHGTKYDLWHEPFVIFDLMLGQERAIYADSKHVEDFGFVMPKTLHVGGPIEIAEAMVRLGDGFHGSIDAPEGVVYRMERKGRVDFLGKYVRADKTAGCYLPEIANCEPHWNWWPEWRPREAA